MNRPPTHIVQEDSAYRILLIEDNPGDALIVDDYLQEYLPRSTMILAKTFAECLKHLTETDSVFDAILLDLNLPDKNGTALIEAVISTVGETPVIVLTGLVDQSFSIKSLQMGVTDYLLKGEFNAFALYKSVVYAIEKGKMSKKMARNNKRLKEVLEIARLGHWKFDREKSVLTCSEDMRSMLKLNEDCDQLPLTKFRKMVHPDDLSHFDAHFDVFSNGHTMDEMEHRMLINGGDLIHVYQRTELERNYRGEVIGINGVIQDITTRKNQEAHQCLLQSVITNAKDTVVITAADEIDAPGPEIIYVNEAFTDLTGYQKEEVIGKSPRILQGPNTSREELSRLKEAMINRKPCQIEVINYHKNGTEYWVEMSIVPVLDKHGRCTHFISIERDVTERKEHERMLMELTQNLEDQVQERTMELRDAHQLLEYHFNQMRDSIVYAERIQRAILPTEAQLAELFSKSFVLFEPRDMVSGDFLWCHKHSEHIRMVAVVDCVGHGVPGAMLSMIGHQLLNQIVKIHGLVNPAIILRHLHRELLRILRFQKEEYRYYEGMDASLCIVDDQKQVVHFCGARQHMYFAHEGKVEKIAGSKFTIGAAEQTQVHKSLELVEIPYQKGDMLFLTSDGFADQFGGPNDKKMMSKRFAKALNSVLDLPPTRQRESLFRHFLKWKKHREQTDDVLIVGVKL